MSLLLILLCALATAVIYLWINPKKSQFIEKPIKKIVTKKKPKEPSTATTLADRKGYDPDFVSTPAFRVTIEKLLKNHTTSLAPLIDNPKKGLPLLHYHHFSVATHRDRKMPLLTVVNIDGSKSVNIPRETDVWLPDPRMSLDYQTPEKVYSKNNLDKGHLVRRLDPVWGDVAEEANDDTFHLTVCAPQHQKLNQHTWLSLEDFILQNTVKESLKVSVFTGAVFSENDLSYRGVLLPLQYWKMAVLIKADGTPSVSAYVLSHKEFLKEDGMRGLVSENGFGEFRTYQIPLTQLQDLTRLSLKDLIPFDPLSKKRSLTPNFEPIEIGREADLTI